MPLTLDYFKTHPLRIARPYPTLTVAQFRAFEFAKTVEPKIHPTAGAFIHYGGVELADRLVISKPTLSDDQLATLANHWNASCGVVARQLLFYVWHIISRELRHGSSSGADKAFSTGGPWHPGAVAMVKEITATSNYIPTLDSPAYATVPALDYVKAVEQHFRKGGWSGAFGGKKWADIALELRRYLEGEASAMVAADRCWTLVHNTGPIFNKGMYFQLHDAKLMSVLNAQASSSVFDLGLDFLAAYKHPVTERFNLFAKIATAAIQKVNPEYVPGQGGAVNADGTKVEGKIGGKKGGGAKGTHAASFGPYVIHTTTERHTA